MPTILFWNFPCRDIRTRPEALAALGSLVKFHQVDVLILAETLIPPNELLHALNGETNTYQMANDPPKPHPKIRFFTRFPASELPPYRADSRLDVRKLGWNGAKEVLLAAIHFYDRANYTPDEQADMAQGVSQTIRDAEIDAEHARTVLFGDLNMNPYDLGMISSKGFASLPTRSLAKRHAQEDYRGPQRFYNPSWSRLGREGSHPSGTFYFNNVTKPHNIFWHHFDQVLVRPALFESFSENDFQIIRSYTGPDGTANDLIRSTGKHWKLVHSDHLPIVFQLRLSQGGQ